MPSSYVLHYSEIALKGKNRPEFTRMLRRAIRRAVAEDENALIEQREGRLVLSTTTGPEVLEPRLSRIFGLAWFARARITESAYEQIREKVLLEATSYKTESFRIEARRNDKSFPMNSMELERRLGADVIAHTGREVDLANPEQTIHVDVLHGRTFVYGEKKRGSGGLPVGTAGRVILLFSGGIDSPVAAWLLMKRGCTPVYLHFYLAPNPDMVLKSKIIRLLKVLSSYSGKSTMILVPFADYQIATAGSTGDLEPSLFRRFMRLAAEAVAPRFGAAAIATGDSLSQTASQTLWNLGAFDSGSQFPVLRPLITYDKEEVIKLARSIGTYETSIEDYKDCCSIVTRHPRTRVKAEAISQQSDSLDFKRLVSDSLARGTLLTYSPSEDMTKVSPLIETIRKESSPVPHQNYKQAQSAESEGVRDIE